MGSKGRMPPPHMRRPLPGAGIMHPDSFGPGIRPPGGPFPFDMLPPPEVMEQKLAAQHVEMQRLATENQRLAATHGSLRQELAAAQQELQRLQGHIGAIKNDKEQHMRGLLDKIAKMEGDIQAAESIKLELQQARADAQSLITARQELMVKVEQLNQELQRNHVDVQQIPALMSELDGLRQEYQHYRATYDYEKKLYNDHLQSLQVMEKNYVSMAREVEKLRAELGNTANPERSAGGPYGAPTGYKENDDTGRHPVGQGAYEDGYGVPQSGCCKPPTSCGYEFKNATFWTTPKSGLISTDEDCKTWSNIQDNLCYDCKSCKASVLANLKNEWKNIALVNVVLLIALIVIYSLGCCAFRNNRNDNRYTRYRGAYP